MIQMSIKTIKIMTIFALIIHLIDVCHTLVDPEIAMCIDGEINTAALTQDGSTYIFMNSWYWKLNDNLDGVESNASDISNDWQNLPQNIETSFHINGETNKLNGKTFFIKQNIWYEFENQDYVEHGLVDNWTDFPLGYPLLAISQYMDPIVVFFPKHSTTVSPIGYYFDEPYFPERKELVKYTLPFDTYETTAIISYPDKRFLVFFDDQRIGGNCILKNEKSGCKEYRLNRDLFDCPEYTKNLFNKNLLIKVWYWSGLGVKQFGILLLGIHLSIALVLIFILFIIGFQIRKLINWKSDSD